MSNGWVKLWRKLLDSPVFGHERLLKLWILCLLKAGHTEADVFWPGLAEPIKLKASQFITGRDALHFDYHQGHLSKRYSRKAAPTAKTLFRGLLILERMQNLTIKTTNKYSIVSVTSWEEYQEFVQQLSSNLSNNCPQTRSIKKNKETPEKDFSLLKQRYDHDLLERVFEALGSTRKGNRVAESVLCAVLKKCEKYPIREVEEGFRTYLAKDYASQGKDEKYLLGIIRNQKPSQNPKDATTGSPVLDAYYARNRRLHPVKRLALQTTGRATRR